MPTKLPPRRTGTSRRRSSTHSPSRARPAPINSSGHHLPYQAQNSLPAIWPVTTSNATTPTPIKMMGPTTEGTRGP